MRLVVDTNVIVSGILSRSSYPATILSAAEVGKVKFILSKAQLTEIGRVLHKPKLHRLHRWSDSYISQYLRSLQTSAHMVSLETTSQLAKDPTDTMFLDAAEEGGAQAIVSGDSHLLTLRTYHGIPVLTPRACVERFGL